jgi:hypothetical protein
LCNSIRHRKQVNIRVAPHGVKSGDWALTPPFDPA